MLLEIETQRPAEQNDGLTPEQRDLRKLFLLSFQYSQGVPNLQHDLFRWSILNGFLPSLQELPDQAPFYIANITPPSLHMRFNINQYASEKTVYEGGMQHEWKLLAKIVKDENNKPSVREYLVEDLTRAMIKRDLQYQYRERPTRDGTQISIPDSYQDSHKSFVRKHVIMKLPAGHPSYDKLFEEMETIIGEYRIENQGKNPVTQDIEIPPGSEIRDGVINRFDGPTALQHLVFAWNLKHQQSGETFFESA
ncbi:MAG TPA: hypothetical protein VES68_03415 [Candidatus Sulfotelmatobacter sp.]|nr:hypothetical protein [Candidatus Sulfotelmatobacter sp.]